MDEKDFTIIKKLLENSRVTYRELAELIDMSITTIHKRIKRLEDDGIINAFIARPSIIALKSLMVVIYGTSKAKSLDVVNDELGQHESIIGIGNASGKFLSLGGILRDISELQDFSNYVSKTGQISEPTIGILNIPYITTPEPLTTIDYRILKSLNRDARKPVTEVSDDIGISTKTVKKRLDRMVENYLAEFSIEWTPMYKDCFITDFHLYLNEGTDLNATIQHLMEKYAQNVSYCVSYSNIPNFITMDTWGKNPQDFQKLHEQLQAEGFKDIIPYVIHSVKYYDCWVDQLLRTK